MLSVDKIEDKIRFLFPFNDFDCMFRHVCFLCVGNWSMDTLIPV